MEEHEQKRYKYKLETAQTNIRNEQIEGKEDSAERKMRIFGDTTT